MMDGETPRCVNCSTKRRDNRRSIRRRRCGARRAAPRRKRFYAHAGVAEADGGFAVTLDGKPIRTPSGRQVIVPVQEIADAIAAEWQAQQETIDPLTMPLTRFANSVVRGRGRSGRRRRRRRREISAVRSAVLSRRSSRGAGGARGRASGIPCCSGPPIRSARISFSPKASCMSASPTRRLRRRARRCPADPWSIAALHVVTTLTGSALLALALHARRARSRSGLGRRPCR